MLPEDVVRRVVEDGWNRGDFGSLRGLISGDAVFARRRSSRVTSLDGLEEIVGHWRAAFPDMSLRIDDIVADGDQVAVRITFSATHEGEWWGLAASGTSIAFEIVWFFRVVDGVIVEIREVDDEYGLREQLRGG